MLSSDEFREFDVFKGGLKGIIQRMMSEFDTIMKDKNLKGKWKIKEIDPDGTTTEFVRCPDPTSSGVVLKIIRKKKEEK